jgi:hypothetical protein
MQRVEEQLLGNYEWRVSNASVFLSISYSLSLEAICEVIDLPNGP